MFLLRQVRQEGSYYLPVSSSPLTYIRLNNSGQGQSPLPPPTLSYLYRGQGAHILPLCPLPDFPRESPPPNYPTSTPTPPYPRCLFDPLGLLGVEQRKHLWSPSQSQRRFLTCKRRAMVMIEGDVPPPISCLPPSVPGDCKCVCVAHR